MNMIPTVATGRFCWVDLAATNAGAAERFYKGLFGWRAQERSVPQGTFSVFALGSQDVASVYQLRPHHLSAGVPSHWTPYVGVADAGESAKRAEALGAAVIVEPFDAAGRAKIALLQDPTGAIFGLWQHSGISSGGKPDTS